MERTKANTSESKRLLTMNDLPPETTQRWVASRKELVVLAVDQGLLTLGQALERYGLSEEEFTLWQSAIRNHGTRALKITQIRKYR